MYFPLQNFIPQAAKKYNFTRQFKAIQVCQEYRKISSEVLSKEAPKHTFPKSYEDHIFTIGVFNSMWSQQIAMKKHLILEALNKKFGAGTVKKVIISMCEEVQEGENI